MKYKRMLKATYHHLILCMILIMFAISGFCNKTFTDVTKFASLDKAKELLIQEDAFTQSWSQFDIDSRLQKQNGTKAKLIDFISSQAREWTPDEKKKIVALITSIEEHIASEGFNIDFPEEIWLVKTTAAEEGGAGGYTRANYIVLKEAYLSSPEERLKQTIVHELFHVLTRNNPAFRKEMYEIIGFNIINPVPYPSSIKDYRITNPDAPQTDASIKLQINNEDVECIMILYSKSDYEDGAFFKYLNVGFMQLSGDSIKEAALVDGKPVIYEMKDVSNFFEQVGKNTMYLIHPEEILADNFAFAVLGKTGLPDMEIVEAVKERLRE